MAHSEPPPEQPPQRPWEDAASRRTHRAITLQQGTRRSPEVSLPLCIWGLSGCGGRWGAGGLFCFCQLSDCMCQRLVGRKATAWKGEDVSEPC